METGNLTVIFKAKIGLEKMDKEDFLIKNDGRKRGHEYKLKKPECGNNVKKLKFPISNCTDTLNNLYDEVVQARNIHDLKMGKYISGDGPT